MLSSCPPDSERKSGYVRSNSPTYGFSCKFEELNLNRERNSKDRSIQLSNNINSRSSVRDLTKGITRIWQANDEKQTPTDQFGTRKEQNQKRRYDELYRFTSPKLHLECYALMIDDEGGVINQRRDAGYARTKRKWSTSHKHVIRQ